MNEYDRERAPQSHDVPPALIGKAPGRRTLTMSLAPRAEGPPAQPPIEDGGERAARAALTDQWMDVAMRPDRHAGPDRAGVAQCRTSADPAPVANRTGLPDELKSGIESLSGMSLDNVKVHYNSSQPAQLNALAYAQGSDIHVAPGQEQHLPHEAWHVVQQAQGRVQPTRQMKDAVAINDDLGLEAEADAMGAKALALGASAPRVPSRAEPAEPPAQLAAVAQRFIHVKMTDKGLDCKGDGGRPPGNLKGSNGDHTTPFTMLEAQVVNALAGTDLDTAWANLEATLVVYTTLPGFETSKKSVQDGVSEMGGYLFDVQALLGAKGNEANLAHAANALLALRNQIDLSARSTKGGGGKNEAQWAGALQDRERKLFLASKDPEKLEALREQYEDEREGIIFNMLMAFDHGRVATLDEANRDRTWAQHCITVTDAYPQLCHAAGIAVDDVLGQQELGSAEWHKKYG